MRPISAFLGMCERVTNTLAVSAIFICMVIVTMDAGGRYLFNSPLPWVRFVLVLYLLPCIFFMGLPGSYRHGVHVSVDILANLVGARSKLTLSIFARVVGLFVFSLLAWYGWGRFVETFSQGEIQPGNHFNYPLWPGFLLIPVGTALAAVRSLERLLIEANALMTEGGGQHYESTNLTQNEEDLV